MKSEKPATISAEAIWNEEEKEWQLGNKNEKGNPIGLWAYWHVDGYLCCEVNYNNGIPPFDMKRFHPNGEVSQKGQWCGGMKFINTYCYIRATVPTPENFPIALKEFDNIWSVEFDYNEDGLVYAQRYFDKKGKQVSREGHTLPERPSNVSPYAYFFNNRWHQKTFNPYILNGTNQVGESIIWEMNGVLHLKQIYNTNYQLTEQWEYNNDGTIYDYTHFEDGKCVEKTYYHYGVTPQQPREITNYRTNICSHFDKQGKKTHTTRREEINDKHHKYYYNEKLILESISGEYFSKGFKRYFYPNGQLITEGKENDVYAKKRISNNWKVFDEKGILLFEIDLSYFMFRFDWKNITRMVEELRIYYTMLHLPMPSFLEKESKQYDWKKIECCWPVFSESIPIYLKGIFCNDKKVADLANSELWCQIEHQGSIYEACYKVMPIFAKAIMLCANEPDIQHRALAYIAESLKQNNLFTRYLLKSINVLQQLAVNENETVVFNAYFILSKLGKQRPIIETFFKDIIQDKAKNHIHRAFAVYCLSNIYLAKKEKDLSFLINLFNTEKNELVQVCLAICLIGFLKKNAQPQWIGTIISALTNSKNIIKDYQQLPYFIDSLQTDIMHALSSTGSTQAIKYIDLLLSLLPQSNWFEQVDLVYMVLDLCFGKNGYKEGKKLNAVQKKSILAIANLLKANTTDVNLGEAIESCNLPYDAYKLMQLAHYIKPIN